MLKVPSALNSKRTRKTGLPTVLGESHHMDVGTGNVPILQMRTLRPPRSGDDFPQVKGLGILLCARRAGHWLKLGDGHMQAHYIVFGFVFFFL